MKKIIILIIGLFLLTGCSVQYNLTINEDLTLVEKASLTGTDSFFANYYKTAKKSVLNSILTEYKNYLDEENYEYKLVEDTTPYVLVSKKYNSVLDFTKSSLLFNDYFDEVKYTLDGNVAKIETIGFNPNDPDNPERFNVQELEIAITCPFNVKNHNATRVDKKTNTYYYKLDSENNKIMLEYNTNSKFNPNKETYLTILGLVLLIIGSWVMVIILNRKKGE